MMTDHAKIDRHAPLRLADAVKIAFPSGGMTVAGLRREIGRNRLTVEVIAGKTFHNAGHVAGRCGSYAA